MNFNNTLSCMLIHEEEKNDMRVLGYFLGICTRLGDDVNMYTSSIRALDGDRRTKTEFEYLRHGLLVLKEHNSWYWVGCDTHETKGTTTCAH